MVATTFGYHLSRTATARTRRTQRTTKRPIRYRRCKPHALRCRPLLWHRVRRVPAQIAQVALWLIDHQMNLTISQEFGEYFVRLPLRKSATIIHGNALRTDWDVAIEPLPWEGNNAHLKFDYIIGNPPFIGKQLQNASQKSDIGLFIMKVKGRCT